MFNESIYYVLYFAHTAFLHILHFCFVGQKCTCFIPISSVASWKHMQIWSQLTAYKEVHVNKSEMIAIIWNSCKWIWNCCHYLNFKVAVNCKYGESEMVHCWFRTQFCNYNIAQNEKQVNDLIDNYWSSYHSFQLKNPLIGKHQVVLWDNYVMWSEKTLQIVQNWHFELLVL